MSQLISFGGGGTGISAGGGGGGLAPIYGQSTVNGDGATRIFPFSPPIRTLVVAYLGGVAALPGDVSIDVNGRIALDAGTSSPTDNVSALYYQ